MAYRIKIENLQIEADSFEEMTKLATILVNANQAPQKTETAAPASLGLTFDGKPRQRAQRATLSDAHYDFIFSHLEDDDMLRSLPIPSRSISRIRWAIRKNRPEFMSNYGKIVLERYNKEHGRPTPKEYLPKINKLGKSK